LLCEKIGIEEREEAGDGAEEDLPCSVRRGPSSSGPKTAIEQKPSEDDITNSLPVTDL
jgi:hypothetical protein